MAAPQAGATRAWLRSGQTDPRRPLGMPPSGWLAAVPPLGRFAAASPLGWLAAAGALAALVDHKTVVLILGVCGLAMARALVDLWRRSSLFAFWPFTDRTLFDRRAVALGAGFSAATFAWWGYGLAVDSATFIRDHLRMHIAHRFLLNDLRLAHDPERYAPSMAELWAEFCAHTGYLFLPVALLAIALWVFTRGADDRRAALAAWCVTGAVLFTLTDWRQSKHLMNGLAPMVAAAVCLAWPRPREASVPEEPTSGVLRVRGWRHPPWRTAAIFALAAALAINLVTDVRLVRDFGSLKVQGASDVDGW